MKTLKNIFTFFFVFNIAYNSNAQLYNNGATITIQPGSYVFVGGDIQNTNSGTITNNGKLEVQGSFINAATYNSNSSDDSLILTGTGNVNLNGGASTINYLTINKTNNTDNVTLTGTTLLGTKLDYTSGNFSTDPINNPSFKLSAPTSAVFNFATGREISGNVQRTGWTNGNTVVFNQTNMLVTTNGGTAPTDFTVTMIPQAAGGDPTQAEREVKRKFKFAQTGGTSFTADIRFAYQDAELNTNTEANLVPWDLIATEWNGKLTPVTKDATANYVSTTGIAAADLANEWKLADSKYTFNATVFLRGAWNSGSGMNNTTLNSSGLIQLTQPYNVSPFNYTGTESVASIPNSNVVDWLLIELRKPSSGLATDATASTIIGSKAGFLLNDGTVVNIDGVTPISFDISKQGSAFVVVRHRNHLAVISNALASNAIGTFANDFTSLANIYTNGSITNDPAQALPGTSPVKYGLWAGNANKDITVNSSDVALVKSNANATLTGYLLGDTNMDGVVNAGDVAITKLSANGSAQTHTNRAIKPNDNKEPKTHVPIN
jgi:hypothetical protein